MKDPFAILGLKSDASEEDIKSAYKALAKKYHPDVNKDAGSEEKFKDIGYRTLESGCPGQTAPRTFREAQWGVRTWRELHRPVSKAARPS